MTARRNDDTPSRGAMRGGWLRTTAVAAALSVTVGGYSAAVSAVATWMVTGTGRELPAGLLTGALTAVMTLTGGKLLKIAQADPSLVDGRDTLLATYRQLCPLLERRAEFWQAQCAFWQTQCAQEQARRRDSEQTVSQQAAELRHLAEENRALRRQPRLGTWKVDP